MNVPHARGLDAWPRRRFSFSRLGNNLHSDCWAELSILQQSGYLGVSLQTFFFSSYQQIPSGKGHADANPRSQMSHMISRLSDDSRGVGEKSPKTRIDLCVCWGCCRNTEASLQVDLPDPYDYYE